MILRLILLFAILLDLVASSSQVPPDLARGFGNAPLQLKVVYASRHILSDGSWIDGKDVTDAPAFVLKRSTNVLIDETFVALILHTTDNSARELHFLQTGLEATGNDGELSSSDYPKIDYEAPTTKNGKGDLKYTFLVYPSPHDGVKFIFKKGKRPINMQRFEEENRLGPALGGLTADIVMDGNKTAKESPSISTSRIEVQPVPIVEVQSIFSVTAGPIQVLPVPIAVPGEAGTTPSATTQSSP